MINVLTAQGDVERASTVLKAMGNKQRLKIFCHLLSGEKSVGQLEQQIGLSQSALSQHLARLRRDALVKTRRSAQTIFYSLRGSEAAIIIAALHGLSHADPSRSEIHPCPAMSPTSTSGGKP